MSTLFESAKEPKRKSLKDYAAQMSNEVAELLDKIEYIQDKIEHVVILKEKIRFQEEYEKQGYTVSILENFNAFNMEFNDKGISLIENIVTREYKEGNNDILIYQKRDKVFLVCHKLDLYLMAKLGNTKA